MYATNAAAAYASVTKSVLGPRDIELRIFQQTNGKLMAARDNPNTSISDLADAVHTNTQLWTLLAVDVMSDDNTLPTTLRGQIASLAIYSQKTGRAVLRNEANINELIEVNQTIIAGLDSSTAPIARQVQ